MAVFGAVITYIMQMIAFVLSRSRFPLTVSPNVSPLGNAAAKVAAANALCKLHVFFLNPDNRLGVYSCAAWYAEGLLYFWLIGRKILVNSPAEEFALKHSAQTKTRQAAHRSPR